MAPQVGPYIPRDLCVALKRRAGYRLQPGYGLPTLWTPTRCAGRGFALGGALWPGPPRGFFGIIVKGVAQDNVLKLYASIIS
jgi:hypothetical protein